MKRIRNFLIGTVISIIAIPLTFLGTAWYTFWASDHTYYDMGQCSFEQSQEIFGLMDLKLYDGITISYAYYHYASLPDIMKGFYFELSGSENDLVEYMYYLEQNSTKEFTRYPSSSYSCHLSSPQLNETKDILFFHYTISGRSHSDLLSQYFMKHGTENIKLSTKNRTG